MSNILDEDLIDQTDIKQPLFSRVFLIVSSIVLIIGILFKINHWPLSSLLITLSIAFLSGHIVSRVIWRKASAAIIAPVVIAFGLVSYEFIAWSLFALSIFLGIVLIFVIIEGLLKFRRSKMS